MVGVRRIELRLLVPKTSVLPVYDTPSGEETDASSHMISSERVGVWVQETHTTRTQRPSERDVPVQATGTPSDGQNCYK